VEQSDVRQKGNSPLTRLVPVGIVRPLFWGLFPEGRGAGEVNKQSNFLNLWQICSEIYW